MIANVLPFFQQAFQSWRSSNPTLGSHLNKAPSGIRSISVSATVLHLLLVMVHLCVSPCLDHFSLHN